MKSGLPYIPLAVGGKPDPQGKSCRDAGGTSGRVAGWDPCLVIPG